MPAHFTKLFIFNLFDVGFFNFFFNYINCYIPYSFSCKHKAVFILYRTQHSKGFADVCRNIPALLYGKIVKSERSAVCYVAVKAGHILFHHIIHRSNCRCRKKLCRKLDLKKSLTGENKKNSYLITGGAIKLTRTMQEREHTIEELRRLELVRNMLIAEGITDLDGFNEFVEN